MPKVLTALRNIVSMFVILTVIVAFIGNLIGLFYTPFILYPYISNLVLPIFIIFPFPLLLFWIFGTSVFLWMLIVIPIVTVSVLFLILRDFSVYVKGMVKSSLQNSNFRIQRFSELFTISIFFSIVVYLFSIYILNYTPHVPSLSGNSYNTYLLLANAGVYEELISRVLLIGVPLLFVALLRGQVTEKNWYRFFVGGKFQINSVTLIFLLFSSVFFGLAHVPSWDWTKFPGAFVAGLILGYLFLRYGIYASISFHFLTDYLSSVISMFPNQAAGYGILVSLFIIFWIVAGIAYSILYLIDIGRFMGGSKKEVSARPASQPISSIDSQNLRFHNIKCLYCGFEGFTYLDEERYQCLRCGAIFSRTKER